MVVQGGEDGIWGRSEEGRGLAVDKQPAGGRLMGEQQALVWAEVQRGQARETQGGEENKNRLRTSRSSLIRMVSSHHFA
ncbi:hypothetical protein GUJ93_ZPchr0010g10886 [Zizania palustris]|uniref:Uncharacterized protein n=1 Tax=Zizania palustris TaxID=103762 RepID=A0A8J5WH20_ZIZPA|nr:hypothetical protein GUJ93_ZPchr0010g10886 [Zizania palustris]